MSTGRKKRLFMVLIVSYLAFLLVTQLFYDSQIIMRTSFAADKENRKFQRRESLPIPIPILLQHRPASFQFSTSTKSDFDSKNLCNWTLKNEMQYENLTQKFNRPSTGRYFQYFTENVYIYSIYLDDRDTLLGPELRAIAIAKKPIPIQCNFQLFQNETFAKVKATWYEITERHNTDYGSYIINCQLPIAQENSCYSSQILSQVILTYQNISRSFLIEIQNHSEFHKFSLCIPPIYGTMYDSSAVIEFVEFNRLLGVTNFEFYVYKNVKKTLKKTLEMYAKEGLVNFRTWNLPIKPFHIWYYGQLAAIHDCLYRSIGRSEWVGFHDLDEFIIPQIENISNWTEMLKIFSFNQTFAGLKFATFYFPLNRSISMNNFELRSLKLKKRIATNADVKLTKCLVRPEKIFSMGIHHISKKFRDDFEIFSFPSEIAAIHHYRICRSFCSQFINSNVTQKYQKNLSAAAKKIHLQFQKFYVS